MAKTIYILFIFSLSTAFSQVEVALSPVSNQQTSFRIKKADQLIDTLSLPFIEDFSSYTGDPDTNKFYNEGGVLINNNYGVGNRSRNIATFDGLMSNGIPYDQIPAGGNPNKISNGIADYLISKPINLDGLTKDDSLVFSFWWQKGGISTILAPELDEGDTLSLYFLDKDSLWVQVWPVGTTKDNMIATLPGDPFQADSIRIDTDEFLHGGFQFMFESYGTLTGNWDVWSIDHIRLDSARNDKYTDDYAFGGPISPLLKNYTSMPYEQFILDVESELADEVSSTFYNLDNIDALVLDSFYTVTETLTNTQLEKIKTNFNPTIPGAIIINPLGSFDAIYQPNKPLLSTEINNITPADDYMVLETTMGAKISDLIDTNNTQTAQTIIDNYYAYDDGSAETGFGIIGTGGIACKFELKKSSTLKSLDLHFIRNGVDNNSATINLKVWKTIAGIDGATETEALVTTRVSVILDDFGINEFANFEFSTPVTLDAGVFYIGWEQINIESRYVIGLDKSQNNMDKVYSFKNSTWGQTFLSTVEGSIMLRPYFGDKRLPTALPTTTEKQAELIIYPNPVSNGFYIQSQELAIHSVSILDLNGHIIQDEATIENNFVSVDLPNGIYIVSITTSQGIIRKKFIVLQ